MLRIHKLLSMRLFLLLPFAVFASILQAKVGEFDIREVSPLTEPQLAALRELVREEPQAGEIARDISAEVEARDLLQAEPQPLEVIHYEGLVNTDPRRIATVAKLREMDDVALLVRYWQLTEDAEAADALRRYLVAWASTYEPTGNDVNENKFYPMLVAYEALRDEFPPEERRLVDEWILEMAEMHAEAVRKSDHLTNRYTKYVRLTAIAGMIFERREWIDLAHEGVKRFVRESLYEDGTSRDLKRRDTLTYHGSALKPMIELAMLAGPEGENLYRWTNQRGGSIEKSVDYVVPYALGEKTREEWTHSKIDLDRKRAEAGLEKYRRGRLYDPQNALELMERASYFDPGLTRVVAHLNGGDETDASFSSWQVLLNEAVHRAR